MTDRWTQARLDGRRQANHEKWREGIAEPERRLMAARYSAGVSRGKSRTKTTRLRGCSGVDDGVE